MDQSWIGHNLARQSGVRSSARSRRYRRRGLAGQLAIDSAVTNTTIEGNLAQDGGGVGSSSLNGDVR